MMTDKEMEAVFSSWQAMKCPRCGRVMLFYTNGEPLEEVGFDVSDWTCDDCNIEMKPIGFMQWPESVLLDAVRNELEDRNRHSLIYWPDVLSEVLQEHIPPVRLSIQRRFWAKVLSD